MRRAGCCGAGASKLTSLDTQWGQFSIEKYAELNPDLLISNMLPPPDL